MSEDKDKVLNEKCLAALEELIKDMQFGNVTLIVQDGKIIQIDKTEKRRLKN